MKLTGKSAAIALLPEIETMVETEAATLIQQNFPRFITMLQNLEKSNPGFLGLLKLGDEIAIDAMNESITWSYTILPETSAPAAS